MPEKVARSVRKITLFIMMNKLSRMWVSSTRFSHKMSNFYAKKAEISFHVMHTQIAPIKDDSEIIKKQQGEILSAGKSQDLI